MKEMLSIKLLAVGVALGAIGGAAVLVAPAFGGTSKGAVVALKRRRSAEFSSTLAAALCTCSKKTAAE
jgi:hypothetical protein